MGAYCCLDLSGCPLAKSEEEQALDYGVTTFTVPIPDQRELKSGTLMSIIRKPQLDRSHSASGK